jgi:single-strand DNA-binding protein
MDEGGQRPQQNRGGGQQPQQGQQGQQNRGGGQAPSFHDEEDLGPAFPSEASGMDDVPF